jgi:predicted kinase
VDATYLKQSYRRELSDSARRAGVKTVWIALDEGKEFLEERIRGRKVSESEATVEVLHHQQEEWEVPIEEETILYLPATTSLEFLGHALVSAHLRGLAPLCMVKR